MNRVLCCWELGGGFGHLFRLFPICLELAKRGCQVICAIPGVSFRGEFFQSHAYKILRAPGWQTPSKAHPLSQTYSQNLLRNGYWHRESLRNQLQGWLAIFDDVQPDIILTEHAPSALLAARKGGLPRVAMGTGFSLPPFTMPMPGLQPWFSLPERHLVKCEKEFLERVNPVLRDLGASALSHVAGIFEGSIRLLCTLPELDHYGVRPDAHYLGPVVYTPQAHKATWPSDKCDTIFLYVKPEHRFFRQIIGILRDMKLPTLAFAPGLGHDEQRSLQGENLSISLHPVNLNDAATHCRLMISEGGHNTGALMLLAGVPLFMCPGQLEQAVWAHRISAQGLGVTTGFFDSTPDFRGMLEAIHSDSNVAGRVKAFAAKHATFDPQKQVAMIAEQCLTLLRS